MTAPLDCNCGTVSSYISIWNGTFPNHSAGLLVQRQQRRIASSRSANQDVAVYERGLRVSPNPRLSPKFGPQILLPFNLPVLAREACQVTIGRQVIEFTTLDPSSGARRWKFRLLIGIAHMPQASGPELLPVFNGQTLDELVFKPGVAQDKQMFAHS